MKKAIAAALLLSTSAPSWALCSYPLDATPTEVAQLGGGYVYQGIPVVNGQTMEFSVVPAPGITAFGAASDTGVQAMLEAEQSGLPKGDLTLPTTGIHHFRMRLNSFPWDPLAGAHAAVWQMVGITTGNFLNPLPKDAFTFSVAVMNSNQVAPIYGSRADVMLSGQSVSGTEVHTLYPNVIPAPLPLPADVVGFWVNMDTREVGLSVHIIDNSGTVGLPLGDVDMEPVKDSQGNPFLVPAGVSAASLMMVGVLNSVDASEPLIGAPVSATLETDYCGSSSGPAPVKLPNGKLFKGKARMVPPGLVKFQDPQFVPRSVK